jgi:hypothetical protein
MLYKINNNIRIFFICILFTYHSISAEDILDLHYLGKLVISGAVLAIVGGIGKPIAYDTYFFLKKNIPYLLSKHIREQVAIEEKEKEIRILTSYVNGVAWRNNLYTPPTKEEQAYYYQLYGPRLPIVSKEDQEKAVQLLGALTIDIHDLSQEQLLSFKNKLFRNQNPIKNTFTAQSEEPLPA